MSFFEELKRRNVVRIAVLYVVASWLILQVADVLFGAFELPPVWMRLVVAALMLGFPIVLIVSWVYEMTPDGLKRDSDVVGSESVPRANGRKVNILIVGLLMLAITVVAVDWLMPDEPPITSATDIITENIAPRHSVAVLPFVNRSARDEDVFFVDGIHDDILTQLARIASLTVISRTSVEKFRDTTDSMQEIGAVLGVRSILEGSVQRAGDRVRINVQLIDVMTDDHLWANTYDHELTTANIFAIQSAVATAIADALQATLSPQEKQQLETLPTENMAALEAYFLGRRAMSKRSAAALADAERHFKRAIELDSQYALAYVGLADTYNLQMTYSDRTIDEYESLSGPLIESALSINGRLGEAYVAKASLVPAGSGRELERNALFRKGLDLAPGYADGHHWYGYYLVRQGRETEGLKHLDKAVRLDPLSSIFKRTKAFVLEGVGRFDEARELYESVLLIDPTFAPVYRGLGTIHSDVYGRMDDAMPRYRQAVALDPDNPLNVVFLAGAWSDLGASSEADRWLERIAAVTDAGFWYNVGSQFAKFNRGDIEDAAVNAEAILAADPTSHAAQKALWILALNDLAAGHADTAVARYRSVHPALLDDAATAIDASNYFSAVNIAYLLLATNDHERAQSLLERSSSYIQTIPRLGLAGYGVTDVRIFAIQGNKKRALAALRQAVDAGWRVFWRSALQHDPALAELHDELEYVAIVAELEADMAAQLKHVREMEASGELQRFPE